MKDKLIFDVSSAATIVDSDNIGAYLRAEDGTLITHSRVARNTGKVLNINYSDFNAVTDNVTVTSHGLRTGDSIGFQEGTGTLPAAFSTAGTYYVIRIDENTIQIANTQADAYSGSNVDFEADGAAGTIDVVEKEVNKNALDVSIVDGLNVEVDLSAADDSVASWTHDGTGNAIGSTGGALHISDAGGSITVDAIDLDIRDLVAATDSVTSWLADGAGTALTSTLVGSDQALDVNVVDSFDAALANTAILASADTLDAANVADPVVASALADRKYLYIRNNDNRVIHIGQDGVTSANGFPVSPGSVIELRAGANVVVDYVSEKIGHSIRVLELS